MAFTWASFEGTVKLIHLIRFSGRLRAQAPTNTGIPSEQASEIGSGTFTPEGIVTGGEGTHPEDFTVWQNHFSTEDAPVWEPDAMAQRGPTITDQVGNGRCLRAAAADHDVSPVLHTLFLNGRVDHAGAYLNIEMLFIKHKIIHPLEIDQQSVFHVGVGTGAVKACRIRHVGNFVSIAYLHNFLDLFSRSRHDDTPRDCGHDPFISQTVFIPAGSAPVPLADYGVVGDIFGANNRFQYIIYFFGYCHDLPP
jgi:hypothetical protein